MARASVLRSVTGALVWASDPIYLGLMAFYAQDGRWLGFAFGMVLFVVLRWRFHPDNLRKGVQE